MMNILVESINSAGGRWAAWVAAASLDAAVLLALVGLVWSVIRRRVAPQVGYCLFLLVPLKLLMPVGVTVPAAVARWTPSVMAASWFNRVHVDDPVASQPPVAGPIAAVRPDQAARSGPGVASFTQTPPTGDVVHKPTTRQPLSKDSPAARGRDDSSVHSPRLSVAGVAMMAWLTCVLLLLVRLARTQLRFHTRLRLASPLDEAKWRVDVRELCRRAGIRRTVRIVESDCVAAPSVWGVFRPTIILPPRIISALTAAQLEWALLHELAHIKRFDLVVVALQRCAAIVHFFNPAVWIANRIIHRLREYACDDLAVSLGDATDVDPGEAFVQILRHADRACRGLDGALGILGLDSRASCFLRVRRLLETERPIRSAPGAWSLWGLILIAVVALPQLRAGAGVTLVDSQPPVKESAASNQANPKFEQAFELLVVGPDSKPVAGAVVELRTSPMPTAEQISQGKFVRRGSYGAFVATDAEGRLAVKLPRMPTTFNVSIKTPGYGPYWASWSSDSHSQPVPARFTAELEAGWSIGGVIVDPDGKPVKGVTIDPSIEFKKRPGDHRQLGVGTNLKTDAAGKWRFDSVPASMREVWVNINHPAFRPVRRSLTRAEFGIEPGRDPASTVVLDRGLTVVGRVTDESGMPVVGALVRTKFLNDIREAKTGADGVYRLTGCEPRAVRIVVSAKGRATDMKELNIVSGMGPVDFPMKPGGTVRIRVLDDHGKPVPKARIFFQRWRGRYQYFEFDHVSEYADQKGVWVWNEAPVDEFKADICPPNRMQLLEQPLIAREQEYVFRAFPALVVSGKVIDAATREPIKRFRVVPGIRSSETHMNWVQSENYTGSDGKYQIRQDRGYFAHLVRIEAEGYQPAVSRDIKSDEGNVSISFELKKGKSIVAKVVTPRNAPAVGAKVALGVAGSQINIQNGDIDDGSTYSAREETDAAGRFHFPPRETGFQLVITHPSGYAHIKSSHEWPLVRIIHLEPWARVEGTFRVGRAPAANIPITLGVDTVHSYGKDVPSIFTHHDVTTGPGGRFVLDRVFPGWGRIGRQIMVTADDGATEVTSSCWIPVNLPAGKTVHVDLGASGRPVMGILRPPQGFNEKVRWNFALVTGQSNAIENPAESPSFTATVGPDGAFRIDDVPVGGYSLSVWFQRDSAGRLLNYPFKVPPAGGDLSQQPVDLGVLTLVKP